MNAWLVLDLRLGGCMFVDSGCLGCAFAVVLLGICFVDLVAGWWLVGVGLRYRFCLLLYLYT